ncbi:MAG TPA: hypothetical protein VN519_15705 [Bryobacteraceae bacterium]|nr:hypothetical protein [Bryobacteraceae bacterium]
MSEKLYILLLKLYPNHFRRAYGDEALRLVLDRARDENGFLHRLRLWFDLLVDLAISLPREFSKAPRTRMLAGSRAVGDCSFHLLTKRSLNPAVLFVACLLTAASLWICVTATAHSRTFPARFPADSYSLQAIVQSDAALAQSAADGESGINNRVAYGFCVTAHRDIPGDSLYPLVRFHFAAPGASGAALIDGRIIKTFKNEQRLWIAADVSSGDHWLVLHVDRRADSASISSNRDFTYCPAK